jgi:hypothetical protein
MRRRRSKLEVSTFPFLAVLLCAMGALLLLLFIMDRRAKIAAKYRVQEELQARQARTKAEEEARQAEWEKARAELHLSLLATQNQLLDKSEAAQHELDEAAKKVADAKARDEDLQRLARDEAGRIVTLQLEIESQRAGIVQAEKKEAQSKAELLAAARELAELEMALKQLRTLKQHEKDVYSLVPYRGKRGDYRTPIYVECVGQGVIFHPDKKLLRLWEFGPQSIRAEIEDRHGPLLAAKGKPKADSAEQTGPYILFLVRPDGIGSYYGAMSALKGLPLDFGYELIDGDWELDVGGPSLAKAGPTRPQQPWKHKDKQEPRGFGGNGPELHGGLAAPTFQGPGGGGSGPDLPGRAGGPTLSPGVGAGSRAPNSGMAGGNPGGGGSGPPSRENVGRGFDPTLGGGNGGGGPAATHGTNAGGPATPGNGAAGPFVPASGYTVDPGGPRTPSFVPIAKSQSFVPIASAGGPATQGAVTPGQGGPGTPGAAGQPAGSPGSSNTNTQSGGGTPNQGGGTPGSGGTGTPGTGGSGTSGAGRGSPNDGGEADPIMKGLPGFAKESNKKPPPAPSPLSKLIGNKDFIVTVNCQADAVSVTPGGLAFRWTAANIQETDQALVEAISNLIARRQASVRPGEPPYHPMIRFQVTESGLRTYYHIYPLFGQLRVPMTRENVVEPIRAQ